MAGEVLPSNRYVKPPGYRVTLAPAGYRPFNGYLGGDKVYGPRLVTAKTSLFTFTSAPSNLSTITIVDAGVSEVFTFTYGGSPGAGIIPLVGGGGTAAQAAAAALVVFLAQLTSWTARAVSATATAITAKEVGFNTAVSQTGTGFALASQSGSAGNVLPARFGKGLGLLSAGA